MQIRAVPACGSRLPAAGFAGIETFEVRIERELSTTGLDVRELASFRRCLDKLELQPGKRIRACNWEKFLSDCSGRALAVAPFSQGAIRTIAFDGRTAQADDHLNGWSGSRLPPLLSSLESLECAF